MYWIQALTAGVYQKKKLSPILFPFFSIIAETMQTNFVPVIFKTTCFCLKSKQEKRKRKKRRDRERNGLDLKL